MAKSAVKKGTVVDVPPVNPEVAMATQEGTGIQQFVAGMRQFFERATTLEQQAKSTLEMARSWKAPKSGDEDAVLQACIRVATADKKEIEEHWHITSLVSKFHKRLVAGRTRGTEPLEEAVTIGNRLHGAYKEAELRRAREEEDRLRREAEDRARQERERELAKLEAEAAEREANSPNLSDREQAFVTEWFRTGGNAQQAARYAGFKDPLATANRLINSEKIKNAIAAKQQADAIRQQAEAKRAMPVEVETVEIKADVAKGGDRTTWSAEVLDEQALINAVLEGKFGIPRDILTIKPAKVNEYARAMHELIDRWPGVRHKKNTSVV